MTNIKETLQKHPTLKTNLQCSLIIALCFLWTSSGYLCWMYNLLEFTSADKVDILTEVTGYFLQALGILIFSLAIKKRQDLFFNKSCFISIIGVDFIFIILAALSKQLILIIIWGFLMNLAHGLVAGFYLTLLSAQAQPKHQALVFGFAYGISSVASWLISLINSSAVINNEYALILYGSLICITVALIIIEKDFIKPDKAKLNKENISGKTIMLGALTVFFISMTRGIGFFFPMKDISGGISLEFSRTFYALGLIVAGIISDRNRKLGAVVCLSSLFFPFATIALANQENLSYIFWILGYFFFGFLAVFRVILFTNISLKDESLLYLSCFGLLFGRLGDAAGNLTGILLSENTIALVAVSSICFVASFVVFFLLYNRLYIPDTKTIISKEERLNSFIEKYELSMREAEVLKLIEEGASNGEISSKLFISENTVKFHVRNILKKTDCTNRVELISMLNKQ